MGIIRICKSYAQLVRTMADEQERGTIAASEVGWAVTDTLRGPGSFVSRIFLVPRQNRGASMICRAVRRELDGLRGWQTECKLTGQTVSSGGHLRSVRAHTGKTSRGA